MNIIKYKNFFLRFSGVLVIASLTAIFWFGFRFGIDFEGGTLWEVRVGEILREEVVDVLTTTDIQMVSVVEQPENKSFLIRAREMTEEQHQAYTQELSQALTGFEELRFEAIGSSIGAELRQKAIWAFILVILAISLYVAFAFRKVSVPVSSWKYGIVTLLTLFHDALIATSFFVFLGLYAGAEVDTNFIIAILVVMGFSVHDTIVVFDRIRENLKITERGEFSEIVNASVNQTLARSVNTSLTLVVVLVALWLFGPLSLQNFVLTILVGTIVGTYSSIFVASPLLVLWHGKKK